MTHPIVHTVMSLEFARVDRICTEHARIFLPQQVAVGGADMEDSIRTAGGRQLDRHTQAAPTTLPGQLQLMGQGSIYILINKGSEREQNSHSSFSTEEEQITLKKIWSFLWSTLIQGQVFKITFF